MAGELVAMVTVSERIASLNTFLQSLADHEPDRHVMIHMQGDDVRHLIQMPKGIVWEYMHSPVRKGCHAARVELLQNPVTAGYYSFVNVDDDVELIEQTNWQPAIDKAQERGVGFVLTNWVKHPNALPRAISIMGEEFPKQVMVYQGGGMAYGREVADIMRALDPVPARFDDIWPIMAYLGGRLNYRYRGSLAIHRIMGKGGMRAYMDAEPRPLLCEKWINYRRLFGPGASVGNEYSIPMDSDIKRYTHQLHREVRAMKGWS